MYAWCKIYFICKSYNQSLPTYTIYCKNVFFFFRNVRLTFSFFNINIHISQPNNVLVLLVPEIMIIPTKKERCYFDTKNRFVDKKVSHMLKIVSSLTYVKIYLSDSVRGQI